MKKITTGGKKVTVAASRTRKSNLSRLGNDFYDIILCATPDISRSH